MLSQSHRIKGRSIGEAFKELCFLWARGASIDFDLLNFQDLLHAQDSEGMEKGNEKA